MVLQKAYFFPPFKPFASAHVSVCYFYGMDTVQLDLFGNPILPQPPAKKAKAVPATNNLPTTPNEPLAATNPIADTSLETTAVTFAEAPATATHDVMSNSEEAPATNNLPSTINEPLAATNPIADIPDTLLENTAVTFVEAQTTATTLDVLGNSEEEHATAADLLAETTTSNTAANTESASTIVYSNNTIAVKIKAATTAIEPDSTPDLSTEAVAVEEASLQHTTTTSSDNWLNSADPIDLSEITPSPVLLNESTEKSEASTQNPLGKRGRKSFKEMDATADLIDVPSIDILEKKLYYSISEVAGWFKVNNSQIRFWENEFDILQPRKTRKGDRLFRVEDIKNLQLIHHLLRNKKYSIEGAKEYLKANKSVADKEMTLIQSLNHFRSFLLELKTNLQAS